MAYTFRHGDRPLEGITIQRAVGRGGFGEVYYAVSDAGKQLALKYLRENPDVELRGISHVMNLKSPNLVTIYDVRYSPEGDPFVVMEYVSGPSLRDVMANDPDGMSVAQAVFFFNGIASGLSFLHDRGVVHRDLKPGNIFYDGSYVVIGDYGLSKHIAISQHSGQTVSVGTVHYMAPEIGSGSYTKAIDIYSLGVILYEMLTGRLPFTGKSMAEILMRHLNEAPDTSKLPAGFGTIIAKALAKDPQDRYQDVNEMVDAVAQLDIVDAATGRFDPQTLSQVPRHEASDPAPTRTSPPPLPPVPPLDARGRGEDSLGTRLQQKFEKKARKLEEKFERRREHKRVKAEQRERRHGNRHASPTPPAGGRAAQLVMLLIVTGGLSMLLGLATGDSEWAFVGVFFGCMIGSATVGTLLAHFQLLSRLAQRDWLFSRMVYVAGAAACLLPCFLAATGESELLALGGALCLVICVCDWQKRIEAGRGGRLKGGHMICPAIIAWLGVGFFGPGADDLGLIAAAMAAVMSMLTEATASLWPKGVAAVDPPWGKLEPPPSLPTQEDRREGPLPRAAGAPAPPPQQVSALDDDSVVAAGQPSFAGKRGGGFFGFVGKLLLTVGVVGALLNPIVHAPQPPMGPAFHPDVQSFQNDFRDVPERLPALIILVGAALVVLSRRKDGLPHMARAVLASAIAFFMVGVAMGAAQQSLWMICQPQRYPAVWAHPDVYGPLGVLVLMLVGIFVMLLWPRDRDGRVVV